MGFGRVVCLHQGIGHRGAVGDLDVGYGFGGGFVEGTSAIGASLVLARIFLVYGPYISYTLFFPEPMSWIDVRGQLRSAGLWDMGQG